jgi:hypothetical protein
MGVGLKVAQPVMVARKTARGQFRQRGLSRRFIAVAFIDDTKSASRMNPEL